MRCPYPLYYVPLFECTENIAFYARTGRLPSMHARTSTQADVACSAWQGPDYSHSCLLQDYSPSRLVSTTLACPVVESWVGNIRWERKREREREREEREREERESLKTDWTKLIEEWEGVGKYCITLLEIKLEKKWLSLSKGSHCVLQIFTSTWAMTRRELSAKQQSSNRQGRRDTTPDWERL